VRHNNLISPPPNPMESKNGQLEAAATHSKDDFGCKYDLDTFHVEKVQRQFGFFRPHTARLKINQPEGGRVHWNSRGHRKGRHPEVEKGSGLKAPNRWYLTCTRRDLTNLSWWVGQIFIAGSIVWVVNGVYAVWPVLHTTSNTFSLQLAVTAMIGGTLFEIGGILLVIEAMSPEEKVELGYEMHVTSKGADLTQQQRKRRHHWRVELGKQFRELGFLGSFLLLISATIYWIACYTAVPSILPATSSDTLMIWAYWFPQVLGGAGFVASSLCYMLEEQENWWLLAPRKLGWQVGFWNLIGSLGFLLCGAFGIVEQAGVGNGWATYQSPVSTLWGSIGFLIGECYLVWIY